MKLISFAVPCYNSQDYLNHCIETLLVGGEDVEIIIINDGSKDRTKDIANEYQSKYPGIVRAVHKENGGHGSGVNRGLIEATGLYYKVVDSDDWLNEDALKKLITTIKEHLAADKAPDMYVCNFVYEHNYDNTSYTMKYGKFFSAGVHSTWDDVGKFGVGRVMLMHALIYKTETLRASNTVLPEKTFYVDNLFAYKPLPCMKTIFYLNVDLYRYFIGRADQSVNMPNLVARYNQQMLVMKLMIKAYTYEEIAKFAKPLRHYIKHVLGTIMMNTLMFTVAENTSERRKNLKEFWLKLKKHDKKMYSYLKFRTYPAVVNWMPWRLRGAVMVKGYKVLCKKYKLG